MACRAWSSRHLPGRDRLAVGALAVLEHDAHRGEFVTDAIALLEILAGARGGAVGDEAFDPRRIDALLARGNLLKRPLDVSSQIITLNMINCLFETQQL